VTAISACHCRCVTLLSDENLGLSVYISKFKILSSGHWVS
jgi:hypothetical protein